MGPATVVQPVQGGLITVTRPWAFVNPNASGGAVVTDTFSPGAATIYWNVSVAGNSDAPWSVAIDTQVAFSPEAYAALKLWSAWDRGAASGFPSSWVDPLQPSDLLPSGWWDGMYRFGSPRRSDAITSPPGSKRASSEPSAATDVPVACAASDFISVPLATVVSASPESDGDAGFTVLLSPNDPPFDTCFLVQVRAARALR
jgi:hypothetical protein